MGDADKLRSEKTAIGVVSRYICRPQLLKAWNISAGVFNVNYSRLNMHVVHVQWWVYDDDDVEDDDEVARAAGFT